MADWTNIPDSSIEPGKPIRSIDGLALRDNPIAISEGASGAPRILDAALSTTVTSAGVDWVGARNAAAAIGAVGTYAVLYNNAVSNITVNSTVAGSTLGRFASANTRITNSNTFDKQTTPAATFGTAQTGTWRCLGYCDQRTQIFDFDSNEYLYVYRPSFFVRIS